MEKTGSQMKKQRIPKKRVFSLLLKWKKRLKIENYQIEIVFSSPDKYVSKKNSTVKDEPLYAEVNVNDLDSKKFILILYDFQDLENTILHELLHVKYWNEFKSDDIEHLVIEKIIEVLL